MKIIEGKFALVAGGNTTTEWMIDGPDLEDRARAAWDAEHGGYYGEFGPGMIYKRGVNGFAIATESPYVRHVYVSRKAAELAGGAA